MVLTSWIGMWCFLYPGDEVRSTIERWYYDLRGRSALRTSAWMPVVRSTTCEPRAEVRHFTGVTDRGVSGTDAAGS
jgi:hypothetical protein